MKIIIGDSRQEEKRKITSWHNWFAWHPVFIDVGKKRKMIWMETIRRKEIRTPHYNGASAYFVYEEPK